MILKANNKLYNCDGWRRIDREDEWLEISFFQSYDVDGDSEPWKHDIEMVDDDYYTALSNRSEKFDYKDIRYIKWRACDKAYLKEFEDDNVECESNS